MSIDKELHKRSGDKCELCSSTNGLKGYEVAYAPNSGIDGSVLLCSKCGEQVDDAEKMEVNHWRCLNDSMWSEVPAVQVLAYKMLNRLKSEGWAQDLLDMLYLEDDTKAWAKELVLEDNEEVVKHIDSNGNVLEAGDSVVLIKDLNVKGGGFTAKRGTPVRNISLVYDNPEHIEGRVEGQQIVIITKYVKKTN